jgi:hypothetical protein
VVKPASIFIEGVEIEIAFIENIGPRNVSITNIEVVEGPFNRIDFEPCMGNKFAPNQKCAFDVECTAVPSAGRLVVEWDVLNENDVMIGFGKRLVWLSCGVA